MTFNQQISKKNITSDKFVFKDNFDSLNQVIKNGPTTNFTIGGLTETESDNSQSVNQNNDLNFGRPILTESFKHYLLAFFSINFLLYGVSLSLFGSALPDLLFTFNTTMEEISYSVSIKSIVCCISIILVNLSFKKIKGRQYQYAIAFFIFGVLTGITPKIHSFKQFLACVVLSCFACSFIESVTNLVVLELFSVNSKLYMQIVHFSFTFGTIIGPLLVSQFLSKSNKTVTVDNSTFNSTFNSTNFYSLTSNSTESRIYIPYYGISILIITFSILMMISQSIKPYIQVKRKLVAKSKRKLCDLSSSEIVNGSSENSCEDSSNQPENSTPTKEFIIDRVNLPKVYYFTLIGLTGVLLSTFCCIDVLNGLFMPRFLNKSELKIPQQDAAFMVSMINVAMAIGRLLTILLSSKTTCKILLFSNFFTILFGFITLTFFSIHSKVLIWFSLGILGLGYSSTYPLVLSYIENRIIITNTIQLFLMFSGVTLSIFIPLLVGYYLDTDPQVFLIVNLFLSSLLVIIMFFIHLVDVWKRRLIKNLKEDRQTLVQEN